MKITEVQFKYLLAVLVTILCFAFFFVRGVDNGIMVLATLAVKHYFDSTASSSKKNDTISELASKIKN